MKTEIILITQKVEFPNKIRSEITFKIFIEFLRNSIQSETNLKTPYFKWILKKFEKSPELSEPILLENLGKYEELLELISTCLLPLASDEKSLWSMTNALSPEIFYGTNGFYETLKKLKNPILLNPFLGNPEKETVHILEELQYGMVLEKVYKLPYFQKNEWIRKFEDPDTGLDKYYLIHIDTRFVDILPANELPAFDCSATLPSSLRGEEFNQIKHTLPLDRFIARGFCILTLSNVTSQQATEHISKLIVSNAEAHMKFHFHDIIHSLQTIVGSKHYQFGIIPFLTINERPALMYENFPFSILIQACWKQEVSKKEFSSLRNEFRKNPKMIVWTSKEKRSELPPLIGEALLHSGINTYVAIPVYFNHQLTGIFEISSKKNHPLLDEGQMIRLRPVLPLISQLIQNLIARFNSSIENIIKEKFTSIQPAVQWKFNETAWHYLRDHVVEDKKDPVENISFKNLYPLYGALDIRNSTILRNEALKKDYAIQLNTLSETIYTLEYRAYPEMERILDTSRNWLDLIRQPLSTQQEIRINDFFNLDVQSELENMILTHPEMEEKIRPYFDIIDEKLGDAFQNRRLLESDIFQLNNTVNDFYEKAAIDLQQIYPCYFEKFRTDGVEYDIYVGQSIAPDKPFMKEYLQKMKRWQLESMISLVHIVENRKSLMSFPLQTTQLLFIHPQTIDITFRKDERRFDVEGAYNIRYHIIKKRIDKVTIQETGERLTQPGKIALVYFNKRDAEEYSKYILQLQEQDLLKDDLEDLELESQQGVNGIRALRVGIKTKD